MSLTSPFNTPAWIDAPAATASSGLTPLCASLPVSSCTRSATAGIRVRAADEDHVVDLRLVEAGVLDRLLERAAARLEQVARHLLEAGTRERHLEVQRTVGRRRDERQVDRRLLQVRELDLRLLGRFLQPLRRHLVDAEVDAVRVLELGDHPVDDALVPVVAAEVRVPRGRT